VRSSRSSTPPSDGGREEGPAGCREGRLAELDEGLSNDSQFSTVKPNPDPNPFDHEPPPGPSVVEELGKAKEQ
jgi:hypothetical protein